VHVSQECCAALRAHLLPPHTPQVDKETFEMLKAINMAGLPGIKQTAAAGGADGGFNKGGFQQRK
jgi:hypothetical protein